MPLERQWLTQAQRELLALGVDQLGLDIPARAITAIELHLSLVQKWRSKINLISITQPRDLITHHALDSLVLLPYVEQSQRVLDFGTGAGFPGMLLASARPEVKFTLLDSRCRRIEFLRLVNTQMKLQNAEFVCARVEDLPQAGGSLGENSMSSPHSHVQASAKFDTLVVRAVASLDQLVQMTASLRFSGQRLLAMKGQYPRDELKALDKKYSDQIESVSVEALEVPFLEAERHVVIIEYK